MRSRKRWMFLLVGLAVLVATAVVVWRWPQLTGTARSATLSDLVNEVQARVWALAGWDTAEVGLTISGGGRVRTGGEARARVDISDGTIVRLAANTEFVLKELSPATDDPVTRLSLAAGKIWLAVAPVIGQGEFEIETPAGVVSVRGTYTSVEFSAATGQTTVTCLSGQCRVTGTTGNYTDLSDGQQASVAGAGQDPTPAQPMDAAQYLDWLTNFPETPAAAVESAMPSTEVWIDAVGRECVPNTIPAGIITFTFGVGRWKTADEAAAAVGDTWPTIMVGDEQAEHVSRSGPEWHEGGGDPIPGWGFSSVTRAAVGPGQYYISAQWLFPDDRGCTLMVTAP